MVSSLFTVSAVCITFLAMSASAAQGESTATTTTGSSSGAELLPYTRCRVAPNTGERVINVVSQGYYGGISFALTANFPMCSNDDDDAEGSNALFYSFAMGSDGYANSTHSGLEVVGDSARLTIPNYGTAVFKVAEGAGGTRTISTSLVWRDIPQYTLQLCDAVDVGAISECEAGLNMTVLLIVFWGIPSVICVAFLVYVALKNRAMQLVSMKAAKARTDSMNSRGVIVRRGEFTAAAAVSNANTDDSKQCAAPSTAAPTRDVPPARCTPTGELCPAEKENAEGAVDSTVPQKSSEAEAEADEEVTDASFRTVAAPVALEGSAAYPRE